MERLKKSRKVHRVSFTMLVNTLKELLSKEKVDRENVAVNFQMLENKMAELDAEQEKITEMMLDNKECTDEELQEEITVADEYRSRYYAIRINVQDSLELAGTNAVTNITNQEATPAMEVRKSHRLPKLEIPKFSGKVRDWLSFWSMFSKVHNNTELTLEDKFQYLLLAIQPDSRAHELVNSFPPTGGNYQKAIDSLKERYGRNDLLIEVYVRELLELVLKKVLRKDEKVNLSSLYDKLETHMRALETLGITSRNCAAMLFPLVESSLPEELLRTWQRTTRVEENIAEASGRLDALMKFLKAEVQNEERVSMAVQAFSLSDTEVKTPSVKVKHAKKREVATAAGLLSTNLESQSDCIFCKSKHGASLCETARKLDIDKRREIAKTNNCCFNCLKKGHGYKRCRYNSKCAWCSKKHVLVMCPNLRDSSSNTEVKKTVLEEASKTQTPNELNLTNAEYVPKVYLQTLLLRAYSDDAETIVRAIIDTGSQRSYVTDSLAKKLGYVSVASQEISHLLFGGSRSEPVKHEVFLLRVKNMDNKYACNFKVLSQPVICGKVISVKHAVWIKHLQEKGIQLTDIQQEHRDIDILIGADVAGKIFTGQKYALNNGLTAIGTTLGWTVMGKPEERESNESTSLLVTSLLMHQTDISDLWKLDVIGIIEPTLRKTQAQHEDDVKTRFLDTVIVNEEGRYEVELPWVEDHAPLPSNEAIARRRLAKSVTRLEMQGLTNDYLSIFQNWEKQGIIERVPEDELRRPCHYLPHRPVVKLASSTPIRPVFDASAREKHWPSLNQCLEKGPNLIELMPALLLRFRKGAIGLLADIEKAFLQISVAPKDRDKLRFLWKSQGKMEVYRHRRVVFGVSCSPFLLGATIQLHLQRALEGELSAKYSESTIMKLGDGFYVDNCICSLNDPKEREDFMKEATSLMAEGGFVLRRWEYSKDNNGETSMVLGMIWNKVNDTLALNLSFLDEPSPRTVTKRSLLAAAHKIFDPIGIACPLMLRPKLLLQKAWCLQASWDEELDGSIKEEFNTWVQSLPALKDLEVPRVIGWSKEVDSLSLHTFCDASGSGYATAVFLRSTLEGKAQVQLLGARGRAAPLKGMTIPRLELLAATIGVRLATSIIEALGHCNMAMYFWSDSTTVLSWIKRESQWNTFVWNRVQEIRRLSSPGGWHHVPGEMNPADLPSRGCTAAQLATSRWWEGPKWLIDEEDWPTEVFSVDEELVDSERRKSSVLANLNCESNTCNSFIYELFDYFSNYFKIVRMVGWIFRFINNSKHAVQVRKGGPLTRDEITTAEGVLLRLMQSEMFSSANDEKLNKLEIFLDETKILRVKTRISNRDDIYEFKFPVILDGKNPLVKRIVEHEHKRLLHAGVQTMMSCLREKYWIISVRRVIRSVVNNCVRCKRQVAKPCVAAPGPLPLNRVRDAKVFEITGVDFAGPLFLKGDVKAWICLFTCAVYRAIHLELVSSLATSSFVEALRRFIARRGRPSIIYSDNGTNFVGFDNVAERLDWKKIAEFSSTREIEWRFNPPSAAWWGGWWERLVRSVKQILRKVLGKAFVNYEEMLTILCDCESQINSRPLTYISEDPSDLATLTPAMFLHDIQGEGVCDCDHIANTELGGRFKYQQKLKEDLRKRFRSEYLGMLKCATVSNEKVKRSIQIGDLVLIGDDIHKRLDWPLGLVISVIPGADGNIRVVKLKTKGAELTRPIQRVFPLEISAANSRDEYTNVLKEKALCGSESMRRSKRVDKLISPKPIVRDYVTRSGRVVKATPRFY